MTPARIFQHASVALSMLARISAAAPPVAEEEARAVRRFYEVVQSNRGNMQLQHRLAQLWNAGGGLLVRLYEQDQLDKKWKVAALPNMAGVGKDLLRGAQPSEQGFQQLKRMGVTTIINL